MWGHRCVFDKDDFSESDFNNAILIAKANNFGLAYSNQAFEYWLILHFNDHQGGGMHRDDYDDRINKLIKPFKVFYDGKKSKMIDEDFFELLDGFDKKTARTVTITNKRTSWMNKISVIVPSLDEKRF